LYGSPRLLLGLRLLLNWTTSLLGLLSLLDGLPGGKLIKSAKPGDSISDDVKLLRSETVTRPLRLLGLLKLRLLRLSGLLLLKTGLLLRKSRLLRLNLIGTSFGQLGKLRLLSSGEILGGES